MQVESHGIGAVFCRWGARAALLMCLGCMPPSGGGSGGGDDTGDEDERAMGPSDRRENGGGPAGGRPMDNQGDRPPQAESPDGGMRPLDDGPRAQGDGPECTDDMGDEERIDTTCAWLAECWDYGVDDENERLCPSYDEESDSEDWDRMCRSAPIDVIYIICGFESCIQAADAWSSYPVEFDALCDNGGFDRPSDPAASDQPEAEAEPEPDCDGETERRRCEQGCEWVVQCAERPQCSGDSTSLRMTCMSACATLAEPLTTLLCGGSSCDEAVGLLRDALGISVPECGGE